MREQGSGLQPVARDVVLTVAGEQGIEALVSDCARPPAVAEADVGDMELLLAR